MNILIFDSGFGGLSVSRAVSKAMPRANITYVADHAFFPYGNLSESALIERVCAVIGEKLATKPYDAVIVACNTASTIALQALRDLFSLPIIGTVPAIKPACEQTKTGMISVLATLGTISREYTAKLIAEFGKGVDVTLVGSKQLANLAESFLRGESINSDVVKAELLPCFKEKGKKRTDHIVLGCTHYPLILPLLKELSPWAVTFIDPAPAIAKRVLALLGDVTGDGLREGYSTGDMGNIQAVFAREGYLTSY